MKKETFNVGPTVPPKPHSFPKPKSVFRILKLRVFK
jgi:hypothetical protein